MVVFVKGCQLVESVITMVSTRYTSTSIELFIVLLPLVAKVVNLLNKS